LPLQWSVSAALQLSASEFAKSALQFDLLTGFLLCFQRQGFTAFSRKRLVQPVPFWRRVRRALANVSHLPLPFAGPFPFRRHSWGLPLQSFSRCKPDTFRFAMSFFPLVISHLAPQHRHFWAASLLALIEKDVDSSAFCKAPTASRAASGSAAFSSALLRLSANGSAGDVTPALPARIEKRSTLPVCTRTCARAAPV